MSKKLLRRPQAMEKAGIKSVSHFYKLVQLGKLPRPVKICGSRSVAWVESEIEAMIDAAVAERDASARVAHQ